MKTTEGSLFKLRAGRGKHKKLDLRSKSATTYIEKTDKGTWWWWGSGTPWQIGTARGHVLPILSGSPPHSDIRAKKVANPVQETKINLLRISACIYAKQKNALRQQTQDRRLM